MSSTIKPRRTTTAGKVPTTSDLVDGELAVNATDGTIFVRSGTSIVQLGKSSALYISDTPPSSPTDGMEWLNSVTGTRYTRYNDGNSTQWVQFGVASGAAAGGSTSRNIDGGGPTSVYGGSTTIDGGGP
jgi:hypothetical protein